jgi:hypothetical protein
MPWLHQTFIPARQRQCLGANQQRWALSVLRWRGPTGSQPVTATGAARNAVSLIPPLATALRMNVGAAVHTRRRGYRGWTGAVNTDYDPLDPATAAQPYDAYRALHSGGRVHYNPRMHVAFGYGAHMCLGAPLARLEAHAVLRELVNRVSRISPAGPTHWSTNSSLRGPTHLPITLEAAQTTPS